MFEDELRNQQHRNKLKKEIRREQARLRAYQRSRENRSIELANENNSQLVKSLERELVFIDKKIDECQAREADLQTELASLPEPTDTD